MKSFIVFTTLVAINYVQGGDIRPKIIGGEETRPGEFPFIVGIYINGAQICVGSLIRENLVLTSGMCADFPYEIGEWSVAAGAHNKSDLSDSNVQQVPVSGFVPHPSYYANSSFVLPYDVGLVHLAWNVTLSQRIQLIALPDSSDLISETQGTIVGWGSTNSTKYVESDVLRKVDVLIRDNQTCSDNYSNHKGFNETFQFCAGGDGKDPCDSDFGAPLLLQGKLYGISSHGGACENKEGGKFTEGSVYTRLPPFVAWIKQEMERNPPPTTPTNAPTTTESNERQTTEGSGTFLQAVPIVYLIILQTGVLNY